jgi:voltage-gated potassium channel
LAVAGVGVIHWLFPGGRFFAIALANFVAIYACIYIFFMEANFRNAQTWVAYLLYGLPLAAFVAGAWVRRDAIGRIVEVERVRDERHLGRIFLWLVPMAAIGALTFAVPELRLGAEGENIALVSAMVAISLIVFIVAGNVASFLIDTGLLFEAFFERLARFLVPAFAFFTFYSLTVIVFAALYRIIDVLHPAADFLINGEIRPITFSEALYFSIVTLSTVGYGDVVPASDLVRVVVSIQMISGVLLLLFGFNELMAYAREHDRRGRK